MVLPIGLNNAFPVCWQCGKRHSMFSECEVVTGSRKMNVEKLIRDDPQDKITDFLRHYEDFVRWYYGERCDSYEADCCTCQGWKAFDKFADDVVEKEPV